MVGFAPTDINLSCGRRPGTIRNMDTVWTPGFFSTAEEAAVGNSNYVDEIHKIYLGRVAIQQRKVQASEARFRQLVRSCEIQYYTFPINPDPFCPISVPSEIVPLLNNSQVGDVPQLLHSPHSSSPSLSATPSLTVLEQPSSHNTSRLVWKKDEELEQVNVYEILEPIESPVFGATTEWELLDLDESFLLDQVYTDSQAGTTTPPPASPAPAAKRASTPSALLGLALDVGVDASLPPACHSAPPMVPIESRTVEYSETEEAVIALASRVNINDYYDASPLPSSEIPRRSPSSSLRICSPRSVRTVTSPAAAYSNAPPSIRSIGSGLTSLERTPSSTSGQSPLSSTVLTPQLSPRRFPSPSVLSLSLTNSKSPTQTPPPPTAPWQSRIRSVTTPSRQALRAVYRETAVSPTQNATRMFLPCFAESLLGSPELPAIASPRILPITVVPAITPIPSYSSLPVLPPPSTSNPIAPAQPQSYQEIKSSIQETPLPTLNYNDPSTSSTLGNKRLRSVSTPTPVKPYTPKPFTSKHSRKATYTPTNHIQIIDDIAWEMVTSPPLAPTGSNPEVGVEAESPLWKQGRRGLDKIRSLRGIFAKA